MTGMGYVRVNEGVGLCPKRHDMRQVGVFNSQGNGSDRGYQFAKVRNITHKNGVRNFWIDVGKTDTGGRSDERCDFNVFIVVFKAMHDGVIQVITSIEVYSNAAVRDAGGQDNVRIGQAFGERFQVLIV